MLVGVQDVAVVAVDEVGDGGDFAFGVGATDQEDGGILHRQAAIFRAAEENARLRISRSSALKGPNCLIHTSMTILSHCSTLSGFFPKSVIFAISLSINDASLSYSSAGQPLANRPSISS